MHFCEQSHTHNPQHSALFAACPERQQTLTIEVTLRMGLAEHKVLDDDRNLSAVLCT